MKDAEMCAKVVRVVLEGMGGEKWEDYGGEESSAEVWHFVTGRDVREGAAGREGGAEVEAAQAGAEASFLIGRR